MRTSLLLPLLLAVALVLSLTLGFCACGKQTDPKVLTSSGYSALAAGDYRAALSDFNSALEQLAGKTEEPQYKSAQLGAVEARIHLEPKQACQQFMALAKAMPAKITDRDYGDIAGKFASSNAFAEAVEIIHAGKLAYAESPGLDKIHESIIERSQKSGDPEALSKLKGLGYL